MAHQVHLIEERHVSNVLYCYDDIYIYLLITEHITWTSGTWLHVFVEEHLGDDKDEVNLG
jgi:hypothetical protein